MFFFKKSFNYVYTNLTFIFINNLILFNLIRKTSFIIYCVKVTKLTNNLQQQQNHHFRGINKIFDFGIERPFSSSVESIDLKILRGNIVAKSKSAITPKFFLKEKKNI